MTRRLFTILSALSLLFVAIVVLWVRSYWVGDSFLVMQRVVGPPPGDHGELSREYAICSARGVVGLSVSANEVRLGGEFDGAVMHPPLPAWQVGCFQFEPRRQPGYEISEWGRWRHTWGGFGAGVEDYRGNTAESLLRYVTMPYWLVCLVAAVAASLCVRAWARLPQSGLCPSCNYDLRATPDRCPECGTTTGTIRLKAGA